MNILLELNDFLEDQVYRSDINYKFITQRDDTFYVEYSIYYKDQLISIQCVRSIEKHDNSIKFKLFINKELFIPKFDKDIKLVRYLYDSLSMCYNRFYSLIKIIKLDMNSVKDFEIINRIDEFDVIINGKLDYINLNNLYDFYEITFNEEIIKHRLREYYINENCIKIENNIYRMKHIKRFNEAIETECQTPDAVYDISVNDSSISCKVELPFDLNLSKDEAIELESNLHNMLEITLGKYFKK